MPSDHKTTTTNDMSDNAIRKNVKTIDLMKHDAKILYTITIWMLRKEKERRLEVLKKIDTMTHEEIDNDMFHRTLFQKSLAMRTYMVVEAIRRSKYFPPDEYNEILNNLYEFLKKVFDEEYENNSAKHCENIDQGTCPELVINWLFLNEVLSRFGIMESGVSLKEFLDSLENTPREQNKYLALLNSVSPHPKLVFVFTSQDTNISIEILTDSGIDVLKEQEALKKAHLEKDHLQVRNSIKQENVRYEYNSDHEHKEQEHAETVPDEETISGITTTVLRTSISDMDDHEHGETKHDAEMHEESTDHDNYNKE